jgi:hypothetical protein
MSIKVRFWEGAMAMEDETNKLNNYFVATEMKPYTGQVFKDMEK